MDEVSYALEERKTVIPILFKPCDIPFRLRRLQHADFTKNYDEALKKLLLALKLGKTISSLHEKDDSRPTSGEEQKSENDENKKKAEEEKLKAQAEAKRFDEEKKLKEQAEQVEVDNESKNITKASIHKVVTTLRLKTEY